MRGIALVAAVPCVLLILTAIQRAAEPRTPPPSRPARVYDTAFGGVYCTDVYCGACGCSLFGCHDGAEYYCMLNVRQRKLDE